MPGSEMLIIENLIFLFVGTCNDREMLHMIVDGLNHTLCHHLDDDVDDTHADLIRRCRYHPTFCNGIGIILLKGPMNLCSVSGQCFNWASHAGKSCQFALVLYRVTEDEAISSS